MKLSVVITCRDDRDIVDTIRSIDVPVEIVVVLNGSPPGFDEWLLSEVDVPLRIERLPHPNRAQSVEHGIRSATNPWVMLIDTDCVIVPGSIEAMATAFERGSPAEEVYKGRIVYEAGRQLVGAVISKSRTQRNRRLSAYKPALAFSKEIEARLGGYFFDSRLIWKSDAELDVRVRRAGLSIVGVEDCIVRHAPLSLRSDLYSSFHYGIGAAIAEHLGLDLPAAERSILDAWRRDGVLPALYLGVSNVVRWVGQRYAAMRIRLSPEKWPASVAGVRTSEGP